MNNTNNAYIEENRNDSLKRLLIFIGVLYLLTFTYEYFAVVKFLENNSEYSIASVTTRIAVAMFIPSICVVITRLFTKEGFGNHYIKLDFGKGKYKYYIFAWVAPAILTVLGALLYFAFFRSNYSKEMTYIIDTYRKQGTVITPDVMFKSAVSQSVTALIIGPVLNCLTCFGEEWGFRGYMLNKLRKNMSLIPTLFVSGIIWGIWHAPLIAMGHNYGTDYSSAPFGGIIAMCVFCIVIGCILNYVTIKTESCIPAVIAHGALNSICSIGVLFTTDGGNPFIGPVPTGIIGGLPFIITAVVVVILMKKDNEDK